jgi:trans-aconitate 2-methyltransferase
LADWNSDLYLKFGKERTQPAIDLVNRINVAAPQRIVDIGCGPGNSTRVLAERFKGARVLGIDSSPNMIEAAKNLNPGLEFSLCDAGRDLKSLGSGFDIVFSNACIQWIPDHPKLLKDMMELLRAGGVLAVQIPNQFEQPIHNIICETAAREKWAEKLGVARPFYNLKQSEYFDVLSGISSDFEIWETTYYHRLKSHEDIIEWYRGTGLKPYLDRLSDEDKADFERDVLYSVRQQYPVQRNGEVIFRFPRLFFTAIK